LFTVSVVVGVDAELHESLVDDVNETENRIVSQWAVSAEKRHELRDRVDDILRPLGFETSLLMIRRANSLALYFICMTLAALMSLRDQWRSRQLRDTVEEIFTFLSRATDTVHVPDTVRVKRLLWPLSDYYRCLDFFKSVEGKLTVQ